MSEPALRASAVSKRYGSRHVLDGIDLELQPGELVALLGPNGCGKTTLMSIIAGTVRPDSGSVTIAGDTCGWVPQGGGTYGRLSVRENLEMFAALLRLPGSPRTVAEEIATRAGLDPWLDEPCQQLSGGTRQRLNVAIGMLGDPRVTVLDEPTTGVDLVHRHDMWAMLRERTDAGGTVLYSTHSSEDAQLADRVLVLVAGTLVYSGHLADVAQFADNTAPGSTQLDGISRGLLALWKEPV